MQRGRAPRRCFAFGAANAVFPQSVLVPERGDFNDDLVAVGASVLAERLRVTLAEVEP